MLFVSRKQTFKDYWQWAGKEFKILTKSINWKLHACDVDKLKYLKVHDSKFQEYTHMQISKIQIKVYKLACNWTDWRVNQKRASFKAIWTNPLKISIRAARSERHQRNAITSTNHHEQSKQKRYESIGTLTFASRGLRFGRQFVVMHEKRGHDRKQGKAVRDCTCGRAQRV